MHPFYHVIIDRRDRKCYHIFIAIIIHPKEAGEVFSEIAGTR